MTPRIPFLITLTVAGAALVYGSEQRFKNLQVLGEFAAGTDELIVTSKAATFLIGDEGLPSYRVTAELRLAAKGTPVVVQVMPEQAGDLAKGGLLRATIGRDTAGASLSVSTAQHDGKAWVSNKDTANYVYW